MPGAFRDDDQATRQRADALERRIQELEAEKLALTGGQPRTPTRKRVWPLALLPLLLGAAVLLANATVQQRLPLPWLAGGLLLVTAVLAGFMWGQVLRARPGELWVISGGRGQIHHDGRVLGYRLLQPGEQRVLLPFVEAASLMSLRPFRVRSQIESAFAPGGESCTASATLLVKLDTQNLPNAVERFLGQSDENIARVAREVLEGTLRTVLSEQGPSDLPRLRAVLEQQLTESLANLGLTVDAVLALEAAREGG